MLVAQHTGLPWLLKAAVLLLMLLAETGVPTFHLCHSLNSSSGTSMLSLILVATALLTGGAVPAERWCAEQCAFEQLSR